MKWLSALVVLLLVPAVAQAQEAASAPSSTYAPAFCNFSIAFPEAPYSVRRCDAGNEERCYDLVSYTQVFDMTTTVNFRVICNPIGPEVKSRYSGEVMQATLRAMTKKSVVQEYNTSFREEEQYKQAGLVGEGQVGKTPTIYIAQLWIGDTSAFSVEAELIGQSNDDADNLFSTILRSVSFKDPSAPKTETEEKAEESEENAEKPATPPKAP